MSIMIADGKKIVKCCLHYFCFNLSSPSGIATCTTLHAIIRFRRQYCSRRCNSDKYTLLMYFQNFFLLLFSERFLEVEDCSMKTGTYKHSC
jgi:hypothetical protein